MTATSPQNRFRHGGRAADRQALGQPDIMTGNTMTPEIHDSLATQRAQVAAMAGYGLPAADIACVLAVDEEHLQANYGHELQSGGIKANARVAESLYRKALGDGREGVTAAIFWLKTRARWKENHGQEVQGKVDTTVTFITTYEDSKI